MSEFSHSLHLFGHSPEAVAEALTACAKPAALVAVQGPATTVVGGWDLAESLSLRLHSVLEYSYAEDHGFLLLLYSEGELVACFNCPFGEQFEDLELEEFETDADQERRSKTVAATVFVDQLVRAGILPADSSQRVLAPLLELEQLGPAATASGFDEPQAPVNPALPPWQTLVEKVASGLALPSFSWLSEDYVFRDYEHGPEHLLERFPALRLFGRGP